MKVLLVGNYVLDRQQSMGRFAALLEQELTREGHNVQALRPPVVFGKLTRVVPRLGKWLGYVDKFVLFPLLLKMAARNVDVVHICDHSNALYVHCVADVPHVVTCHDMLAIRSARGEIPENRTVWTGRILQRIIVSGLSRACHVVCDSEQTRGDFARIAIRFDGSLSTTYPSLNYHYAPMSADIAAEHLAALGVNTPFLLHVGNNSWYKNRLGVLRIFSSFQQHKAANDINLVLAGRRPTEEMRRFIFEHQLQDKVQHVIDVDNDGLCALYSTATALLFPSLQEGFGWPLIEAQACGCPVITSNRAPMTEVAGAAAALYIDPQDTEAAARIIAEHLPELQQLRRAGFDNVQRFSTRAMIAGYIRAYKSVCPTGSVG